MLCVVLRALAERYQSNDRHFYRDSDEVSMSTAKVEAPEGNLLNILEAISPLCWRRYRQRTPMVWNGVSFEAEDQSHLPPFVAFRFEQQDDGIVAQLKWVIEGYSGTVRWSLREHKRHPLAGSNWIVEPSRLGEIAETAQQCGLTPDEYLGRHEPEAGPVASADLVGLVEHVRLAFALSA